MLDYRFEIRNVSVYTDSLLFEIFNVLHQLLLVKEMFLYFVQLFLLSFEHFIFSGNTAYERTD
jgi:hypothetical protein